MLKKLLVSAFFVGTLLSVAACADYKAPPSSPSGGIGSPNGPATGPAFQGVQG